MREGEEEREEEKLGSYDAGKLGGWKVELGMRKMRGLEAGKA